MFPIPRFRGTGLAAAVGLSLTVTAPVTAQDTPPELPFDVIVPEYTADRQAAYAVAAARSAWVDAFESQDVERMMSFYVDDIYSYDMMAAPADGGMAMAFDGRAAWQANWVSFFDMFEDDLKVTIDNLTVYQAGDIATVRGLTRLQGTAFGQHIDMWARETNVLHRVGDRWLVVHDHVSVPIDFASGQALMNLTPRPSE